MDERPLTIKEKLKTVTFFVIMSFVCLFLSSCQTSETNKWTPPKFVKEWEIKEIKPGLEAHIISITANKYGVFVLVNAEERKYTPPKKWSELTEQEKEKEIKDMKFLFGRILSEEERLADTGGIFGKKEKINHIRIQNYNLEGDLIREWPREGINFKEPMKILSDDSGNIYTADYEGNEIIRFDIWGALTGRWKMLPSRQIGEGFMFKGIEMGENGHILITGQGDLIVTPKLFQYDTNGKLIKSKELRSGIQVYLKLLKSFIPSLMKIERIGDMAVDVDGNIYFLKYENMVEKPTVIKLSPEWKHEREFRVILKEGFEVSKVKQYEKYLKGYGGIKKFDSTQMSWIETRPGLYFPSNIFIGGEHIYVILTGSKPFGVIDAVIYDKRGKMIGFWKKESKNYMEWYKTLKEDIEVIDLNLSITQYDSSIFMARTMEIRTGAFYTRSVIQRFQR